MHATGADSIAVSQTSSEKGTAYCKRKVNFLREQIQKVVQVRHKSLPVICMVTCLQVLYVNIVGAMQELKSKQRALEKVSSVLQQKAAKQ